MFVQSPLEFLSFFNIELNISVACDHCPIGPLKVNELSTVIFDKFGTAFECFLIDLLIL